MQPSARSVKPDRLPARRFHVHDIRWVRFARQAIADGAVEPMGHELSFRWDDDATRSDPPSSPFGVSMTLSHALLDGGLRHRSPGRLFVTLDQQALLSPVADALCAPHFVIQLAGPMAVDNLTTRRIAQLHARGYRFALADLRGTGDARWSWAPFAAYAKLRVPLTPPGGWEGLMARAHWANLQVIADGLMEPTDYLRLRRLGVHFFQGDLIHPPQEELVRALPSCDAQVLQKLNRLVEQGAGRDTLAMVAATDPALVIRLLMLQRLYSDGAQLQAALLTDVLETVPYRVLGGWLRILRGSSFDPHERGRAWSTSVREQMYNFRARLIGARACGTPLELEARVFDLYRRLCSRESLVALLPTQDPEAADGEAVDGGGAEAGVAEGAAADMAATAFVSDALPTTPAS